MAQTNPKPLNLWPDGSGAPLAQVFTQTGLLDALALPRSLGRILDDLEHRA